MPTTKRHTLARRHDFPRPTTRSNWPQQSGSSDGASIPPDNQILHGLMIGLPLGLAIWILLALAIWWIA
jgi:hypothetical protein